MTVIRAFAKSFTMAQAPGTALRQHISAPTGLLLMTLSLDLLDWLEGFNNYLNQISENVFALGIL